MRFGEKLPNGVMDSRAIECPVCYGNNIAITGSNSDGRTLTIHFTCSCGAMYVYEYVREGTETIFMCKLVA